jgi:hypothetical protein
MMLDYWHFTSDQEFARNVLLPTATSVMTFFREHYERFLYQGAGNKMVVHSQGLETVQQCTNPATDISGLLWILPQLLALPASVLPASVPPCNGYGGSCAARALFVDLLAETPDLKIETADAPCSVDGCACMAGDGCRPKYTRHERSTGRSADAMACVKPQEGLHGQVMPTCYQCSSVESCETESAAVCGFDQRCRGFSLSPTYPANSVSNSDRSLQGLQAKFYNSSTPDAWLRKPGVAANWTFYAKQSHAGESQDNRYVADCGYKDIDGYQNGENIGLYAVFPFRLYGLNSTVGRNTYRHRRFQNPACSHFLANDPGTGLPPELRNASWNCSLPALGGTRSGAGSARSGAGMGGGPSVSEWQESQQAALLGMRDEAALQVMQRAAWGVNVTAPHSVGVPGATDHQMTFPGFIGLIRWDTNGFPDLEHTAQMRTTVQYMLLQNGPLHSNHTPGKGQNPFSEKATPIWLFAALPRDIDVQFKLPAFHNTTVKAECKGNAVVSLEVTPPERKNDVVLLGCKTDDDSSAQCPSEHDNFICSRTYGPGAYPLPCRRPRDHWQSAFKDVFGITAWWPPSMTYENGTLSTNLTKSTIVPYAEAHFNMLFGGDGNIRCDDTDPDASGPPGSPMQSFDCLARALQDLERLGLKLSFHPSDIMINETSEIAPFGTPASVTQGGTGAMGGVTEGGPGDWASSKPEVEWVVKMLRQRNLSHNVAQFFFHDDEIGDSAATADAVRWLWKNAPTIVPQANTFSDSAPESLYMDGQLIFAPEQYAISADPSARGGNYDPPGANTTAMVRQQMIMFANDQLLSERYRLDHWPLQCVPGACDSNDQVWLHADSLIRVQAFGAIAYGARGLYYYDWGFGIWGPKFNNASGSNYDTVKKVNVDAAKWGTLLLNSRHVGAVRTPSRPRRDHSIGPAVGCIVEAMDNQLLVGVFSDGLSNNTGWLMVVDLRTANRFGGCPARNATLRIHKACRVEAVPGGPGGWAESASLQASSTTTASADDDEADDELATADDTSVTVQTHGGGGALLRITGGAGSSGQCGTLLRSVRRWWFDPRAINLVHSYPETSLKSATYGGNYWMPQNLDSAARLNWGSNGQMFRDATGQGFGRGWCNQRPCLPGRARFYHMPGGLAGATSNFIIGGSLDQPWSTDAEAKAWADAAFLVAALPATPAPQQARKWQPSERAYKVTAEQGGALALALGHATAHGMFVLAAPTAGAAIAPVELLRVAEDTSCHTNFAGFVLSSDYSAADKSAVVSSADAMRSVAYWTLPLVLGVASVADAVALGERGVPFPAIALPKIDAAQPPTKWAQVMAPSSHHPSRLIISS